MAAAKKMEEDMDRELEKGWYEAEEGGVTDESHDPFLGDDQLYLTLTLTLTPTLTLTLTRTRTLTPYP